MVKAKDHQWHGVRYSIYRRSSEKVISARPRRTYIRHGKEHKASAPGEPPAVDTGRLRSSITHAVETTDNEVIGYVGSNVEYAKWLELGTERVAERPFLRPALFNNQAEIAKKFIEGAKR